MAAYRYEVKRSTHSKEYFYITEIETDEFGCTERAITKPLTKEELWQLSNKIREALPSEGK